MFLSRVVRLDYCKYLLCLSYSLEAVSPSASKYFQSLPKYQSGNIHSICSFSLLLLLPSLLCVDYTHQHHINNRTILHGLFLYWGSTDRGGPSNAGLKSLESNGPVNGAKSSWIPALYILIHYF